MPYLANRGRLVLAALLMPLIFISCKAHTEIRHSFMEDIRYGNYGRAYETIKKIGGKNKQDYVVDCMDRGMVLHLMGKYDESNVWLSRAEDRIDELFTKHVSDVLKAIAWNDTSMPYRGEEFERIMVNIIMSLNYLMKGNLEDAMVEVRKVNHKLAMYAEKLKELGFKKYSYKIDAFANYLAGLISEASGEVNDAYISYVDAYKGYQLFEKTYHVGCPDQLKTDILRTAKLLGLYDEYQSWKKEFGEVDEVEIDSTKGKGELIALIGIGRVAYKVSKKWMVPDPQGDMIAVTYPEFKDSHFAAHYAKVEFDSKSIRSQVVDDISEIAKKNLSDRNAEVKAKAIARALASYAGKKIGRAAMRSSNNTVKLIGFLTNVALNVKDVVEVADTRSWVSLPDDYQMVRTWLPPGKNRVKVGIFTGRGRRLYDYIFDVQIIEGGKTFLVTYGPDKKPKPAPGAGKPALVKAPQI